jgi:transcription elongation factor Elf1
MVYYGQTLHPAQLPPPFCPKCGSHRTQIVGRSSNAKTVVVRCSACGERSSVVVNDPEGSQSAGDASIDEMLEVAGR